MKLLLLSSKDRAEIQKQELKILHEIDRICLKYGIHYSVAYGTMIGAVRHHGFIPWDDDVDILMMRNDYIRFKDVCKNDLGKNFFYQSNDTDHEYYYLFDKIRLNNTVFRESFVSRYNIHHGIYVDIFPIDKLPNKGWKRKLQFVLFHFCRTGVQAKYLMLGARHGKKKIVFGLLRLAYAPFSLKWLYSKAHQIASMYNCNDKCKEAGCFFSPYQDFFDISLFQSFGRCNFENIEVEIIEDYDKMLKQIYGDYMKFPPVEKRVSKHTITELKISD